MGQVYASLRNLQFLLYEVLEVTSLTHHPHYGDHDRDSFDMILESALQIGDTHMRPYNREMDRNPPDLVEGKIKVHPKLRDFMKVCGEGGWISATFPTKVGGMQLPHAVNSCVTFLFNAANYSASVYPFLTSGAAGLIHSFGREELKNTYLPKMFSGEWQGTMALTEPDAGSSLSDIRTLATPSEDGHYLIQGQKIYISCGDHDACDNVIHLMLARTPGAPLGVKGISLFVVPQQRLNAQGTLQFNHIDTAGVYHKMGYHGAPIAHLMMGQSGPCHGYLVGEENKGLLYMFQMMNEARIGVGLNATAIASAAYYDSLDYALVRPQGRKIDNKDLSLPQIPIIQHADVKRMLLFQKAVVEGSLSLLIQCAFYQDLCHTQEGEEKENNQLLLDFLTPIAKSYPSEMGVHSTSAGIQILGGAGFLKDFSLEQFFRESRIHPIHEGTSGIHGIDLLGRKVAMLQGKAFRLFLQEIQNCIAQAEPKEQLQAHAHTLKKALEKLEEVTFHLIKLGQQGQIEHYLADATLYLEMTGIIAVAWQWLKQGLALYEDPRDSKEAANGDATSSQGVLTAPVLKAQKKTDAVFYESKMYTLQYFFEYELPKVYSLAMRLQSDKAITVRMPQELFV